VKEKYCWLAGGWWLVLNWCERKALLADWIVYVLNVSVVFKRTLQVFYLDVAYIAVAIHVDCKCMF
jgi:hypothetical protein